MGQTLEVVSPRRHSYAKSYIKCSLLTSIYSTLAPHLSKMLQERKEYGPSHASFILNEANLACQEGGSKCFLALLDTPDTV